MRSSHERTVFPPSELGTIISCLKPIARTQGTIVMGITTAGRSQKPQIIQWPNN